MLTAATRVVLITTPVAEHRPASGPTFSCLSYIQMVCDIATALYYPGIDPFTKQEVHVAGGPLFPKPTLSRLMRRPAAQLSSSSHWTRAA
jgi:hypothetical protein